ncbi:hypothetical protein ACO0LG_27750 [Undibacterium sp. Ji42W]|uniref:hypothetical protein n=1 Tax=Undibacterium sp. Ji42W TaxID=3413039 RepID=UPI003BF2E517
MHSNSIRQDQSMHCLLAAGSTLYVKTGKLRLIAWPHFIEGLAWQADTVLDTGSVYQVPHDGWVELRALQTSDVLLQKPEPAYWRQALVQAWQLLRACWRGHQPH